MSAFFDAVGTFAWGFVLGYFWRPVWDVAKKIWAEAKLAKQQWRKP